MANEKKINEQVSKIIARNNQATIDSYLIQNNCNHDWYKYGLGFKCMNCEYYSGLHGEVNELLKQIIKP